LSIDVAGGFRFSGPHSRMAGALPHRPPPAPERRFVALGVAALGIVFGDIGTSPLYALHVCFTEGSGLAPTLEHVLGVLSLVFWALIIVVSVKYVVFVMRADLNGEGGILALMALTIRAVGGTSRGRPVLVALGLFGAALLYGDGMLTPAISVLSAVEGLKVATPVFTPAVEFITIAVLIVLFLFQRHGMGRVGAVFGPIMLAWFAVLFLLGLRWIATAPQVLGAISPHHAVRFFATGGLASYWILGAVFLVVTGGEALYADIGHFGKQPIRFMWFAVVLPAVVVNYFGQGAMLLQRPDTVHHTFYSMAPEWSLMPLVVLATAAAVIASQAIIAGAFSLTAQALQLGFTPRIDVVHSSADEEGQVYVPLVNWILLLAAVFLVLHFRTSSALAGAYGVAVSGTMVLTTVLACVYFGRQWGWAIAIAGAALFLLIDVAFLGANLVKVDQGGWFPLLVAIVGYAIFTTWTRGQSLVTAEQTRAVESEFARRVSAEPPLRVDGTAVYFTRSQAGLPRTLLLDLAHHHVLHRHVLLLTVLIEPVPRVPHGSRFEITRGAAGLIGLTVHYGYMQRPNIPHVLRDAAAQLEVPVDPATTTYFLARVRVIITRRPSMARWRKRLYKFLAHNAVPAAANYCIPPEQVFEIGVQVEI
jgi:KUP system potassium uptake protein